MESKSLKIISNMGMAMGTIMEEILKFVFFLYPYYFFILKMKKFLMNKTQNIEELNGNFINGLISNSIAIVPLIILAQIVITLAWFNLWIKLLSLS